MGTGRDTADIIFEYAYMKPETQERAELNKIKEQAEDCEAEPVATPGAIQPHGVLLVLSPDYQILQASNNAEKILGLNETALLDEPLNSLLGDIQTQKLQELVASETKRNIDPYLRTLPHTELIVEANGEEKVFDGILHRNEQQLYLLELEPRDLFESFPIEDPYQLTKTAILKMQQAPDVTELYNIIVDEIALLTGFDRIMVYHFDEDYNGSVKAEFLREGAFNNSYLGLHFPDSDIPANARALYQKNWLRLIPDREYEPVGMCSADSWSLEEPLDMSQSVLRSVSHYHVEYLQVINVRATMSISVFEGDRLWGLIACHSKEKRFLPYSIRMACEFIAQSLTLILTQWQRQKTDININNLNLMARHMMADVVSQKSLVKTMQRQEDHILDIMQAQGFAYLDHQVIRLGTTPSEDDLQELRHWLDSTMEDRTEDIYFTNQLPKEYEPARNYQSSCSGLLAIYLEHPTPGYLLWFRKEEETTVNWAGKPEKNVVEDERGVRFSPRKSFEIWKEQRKGRSRSWDMSDLHTARQFRTRFYEVQLVIYKQFEQKNSLLEMKVKERTLELEKANARLSKEISRKENLQEKLTDNLSSLQEANEALERFAYVASHDLREPLRVVSNFSQMLEKKYGQQLDKKGQQYIQFIKEGTVRMQHMISDLLKYSRVQKDRQNERKVSMDNALHEALQALQSALKNRQAEVKPESPLPSVWGERGLIIQLLQNLLDNAIKYHHPDRPPRISIWVTDDDDDFYRFHVQDNGIGIASEHHETIFDIFQRLHTAEEYEGTGIGLSICQKIVEKYGGEIGVDSEPGRGSTFHFTLPKAEADD